MSEILNRLYGLLAAMVAPEKVVFSNQNAPRPAAPYWTLYMTPLRHIGRDAYGQGVDDAGDIDVHGQREATVQVQRLGRNSESAVQDLRNDLARITIQETWQRQGISAFDTGEMTVVPYMLDVNNLEPRASLDIFIRFHTRLLDRVGVIETVHIGAGYITGGTDADPDLNETVTIVL